jgi:hypothetical protein
MRGAFIDREAVQASGVAVSGLVAGGEAISRDPSRAEVVADKNSKFVGTLRKEHQERVGRA